MCSLKPHHFSFCASSFLHWVGDQIDSLNPARNVFSHTDAFSEELSVAFKNQNGASIQKNLKASPVENGKGTDRFVPKLCMCRGKQTSSLWYQQDIY